MPTSQNKYPANDPSLTKIWRIPGTERDIRLNKGDAGFLLVDLAAWFDKHVETIDHDGQLDDWGYAERPIRGSSTELSNHASGTAIDLNATQHPLGKGGTFTPAQVNAIRDRLKVYGGCIRWGGDYQNRLDAMHFEINSSPAKVARVAKKLRAAKKPVHDTGVTRARALLIAEGVKAGPMRRAKIRAALAALPKW